jgi:hypothetical protein
MIDALRHQRESGFLDIRRLSFDGVEREDGKNEVVGRIVTGKRGAEVWGLEKII